MYDSKKDLILACAIRTWKVHANDSVRYREIDMLEATTHLAWTGHWKLGAIFTMNEFQKAMQQAKRFIAF